MALRSRRHRRSYPETKNKKIYYFTVFVIVFLPLYFGYNWLKSIGTKKEDQNKIIIETGDRPLDKTLSVLIHADGGLNFRKEPNKNAEKIGRIPDGVKVTVKKEIDGWYQISYEDKEGWIAKEFTILEEDANKVSNVAKDWPQFSKYGFSVKYPLGWSVQDYGSTTEGESVVAFSFSQLPSTMPAGSVFFAPIDIKISPKDRASLENPYKQLAQKTVSEIDIAGTKGAKYIYTDSVDSTEKTRIFFTVGANTFVISENGGYQTELDQIITTFKLL